MSFSQTAMGWSIPATETESGLTVVQAPSLWGLHYEVGQLHEDTRRIHPQEAKGSSVISNKGAQLMHVETRGPVENAHRAAAALVHFCIIGQELQPDDVVTVLYPPDESVPHHTSVALQKLGFMYRFTGDNFVAQSYEIQAHTCRDFPEFMQAQPLPGVRAA
jgi:hypothetical protein